MNSIIIKSLSFAIAAIVSIGAQSLQAQDGLVAILDVAKVFDNNQAFKSQMELIKADADKLKTQITQQQEAIKVEAQGLGRFEVGSTERNNLEGQLEIKQANLRTFARQQETVLLNREARVYYDTYLQMQTVVESLANSNGISLVLRFESAEIDPDNRTEVVKGVNRSVVYHRKLDLTGMVTTAMNGRTARAPTGTLNK